MRYGKCWKARIRMDCRKPRLNIKEGFKNNKKKKER